MTVWQPSSLGTHQPGSSFRLTDCCPKAKLAFHVGIAFVKCERVNNSISPKCQFYRAPKAVKTISSLEVVSPEKRIIDCVMKLYLWLFDLASLFILRQRPPSGKQYLSTIRNFQGPQFERELSFQEGTTLERVLTTLSRVPSTTQ